MRGRPCAQESETGFGVRSCELARTSKDVVVEFSRSMAIGSVTSIVARESQ